MCVSVSNVCVECGEPVTSLYIEYSKGNIKLTRCDKCGSAVDKFIEYELILVILDVVLHRQPAYRHLYFNRKDFWISTTNSIRGILFLVLGIDMVFKVIVLHKSLYHPLFILGMTSLSRSLSLIFHLMLASTAEHLMFVVSFFFFFMIVPQTKAVLMHFPFRMSKDQFRRKLYISLALPESFKAVSIVLQLFDNDPFLLTLLTFLILSVQHVSFQTMTGSKISSMQIYAGLTFGTLVKMMVRRIFMSEEDIFLMGIIS